MFMMIIANTFLRTGNFEIQQYPQFYWDDCLPCLQCAILSSFNSSQPDLCERQPAKLKESQSSSSREFRKSFSLQTKVWVCLLLPSMGFLLFQCSYVAAPFCRQKYVCSAPTKVSQLCASCQHSTMCELMSLAGDFLFLISVPTALNQQQIVH